MTEYIVTWEIEVDADSPRQAAEIALSIQRDQDSTATTFDVMDCEAGSADPYRIDLQQPEGEGDGHDQD